MKQETDIESLGRQIVEESAFIDRARQALSTTIIGQTAVIDKVMIALLANGHLLLEGVPGLAKTLIVRTFASAMNLSFHRIQFTPDMLPADLIGTMIYNPKTMEFHPRRGPVFANVILADEINRSPAKVQSALLEAMQEKQVTIGDVTYPLGEPFMVLATQNPVEHEGTYMLPEAQLDRFMMKIMVEYPTFEEELEVMQRASAVQAPIEVRAVVQPEEVFRSRSLVDRIYVDQRVQRYIVDLVTATRSPERYGLGNLSTMIEYGASPRASIFLLLASKAHAFLQRRAYATPEDVKSIVYEVLRHRVRPSYEAEAENMKPEEFIRSILEHVQVP